MIFKLGKMLLYSFIRGGVFYFFPGLYNLFVKNMYIYSKERMKPHTCLFMKQNCQLDRGLAQYKNAILPLSFLGINTTLLGFPKRYITLVYLKGLKSYQPSKFKRVDFLPLYLVKRTFRLHFFW